MLREFRRFRPFRMYALVALPVVTGTLSHSTLFPYVIELNSTRTGAPLPLKSEHGFGNISFREHVFQCSKHDLTEVPTTLESYHVQEKRRSLAGVCWDALIGGSTSHFYRVCIGNDIQEHTITAGGTRTEVKRVGTLAPNSSMSIIPGGMLERFVGPGVQLDVHYSCNLTDLAASARKESNSSNIAIHIATPFMCSSLSDAQRREIAFSIPYLKARSENGFWEYQFNPPSHSAQIHLDFTGLTKNETYSLGSSNATLNLTAQTISSLEPDDVISQTVLELDGMTGGTYCKREGMHRQAKGVYQCPSEWADLSQATQRGWVTHQVPSLAGNKQFRARIRSVHEDDYCEYTFEIESTAFCTDSQLIPRIMEVVPQAVQCTLIN